MSWHFAVPCSFPLFFWSRSRPFPTRLLISFLTAVVGRRQSALPEISGATGELGPCVRSAYKSGKVQPLLHFYRSSTFHSTPTQGLDSRNSEHGPNRRVRLAGMTHVSMQSHQHRTNALEFNERSELTLFSDST